MKKLFTFALLIGLVIVVYRSGLTSFLSFEALKNSQAELLLKASEAPLLFAGSFFAIYVLSTAFSLPGATILTIASGALFGLGQGFLLASFASSIGATLAFLATRYLLRDSIEKKFHSQLKGINEGIKREGAFYLFTLRLVPLFPFFVINMLMGLTQMRVAVFYGVSQIGMILGTLVYVNAGTELSKLESASGILSLRMILSFALLGILPLVSKRVIETKIGRAHV